MNFIVNINKLIHDYFGENTGELTATVRVAILKQDYEENVNKELKVFQHKANIPGFRPGKVPIGMVRKCMARPLLPTK